MTTVASLHRSGREDAVDVLSAAFATDPVWSWLVRAPDRARRLQPLFGAMVAAEMAKPHHLIDVAVGAAGTTEGVAVWHDVDDWRVPPGQIVRRAPAVLRACRLGVVRTLRTLATVERAHPAAPHRYLALLAVHPAHQGRGIGGALLTAALDRCDDQGLGAYLESSNPRNQGFYARCGFVAAEPLHVSPGAPPITPMWRDAR